MKRRTASSIALTLGILVSLVSLPATTQAQQRPRFMADTGFITLGPNQVLRLTATTSFDPDGGRPTTIGIRQFDYVQTNCAAGICKHAPVNPNPVFERYDLIDAISRDIPQKPGSSGVRAIILSQRNNVRVTAMIINTVTGEITSHIILANRVFEHPEID